MVDAWGYKLADHPNDKGFRAAYRAMKNSCMLQVCVTTFLVMICSLMAEF